MSREVYRAVNRTGLDGPARSRRRLLEQLLEGLDLQQQESQVEEDVDDLGTRHQITPTKAHQCVVDYLGELLSARLHDHRLLVA